MNWCYLRADDRFFFTNYARGNEINFDSDYFPIFNVAYDDDNLYLRGYSNTEYTEYTKYITMWSPLHHKSRLVKLYSRGIVGDLSFIGDYDDLPTYVFLPAVKDMDEPLPVAFIGKKQGKYILIDSDLKTLGPFDGVMIKAEIEGYDYNGRTVKPHNPLYTLIEDDID